VDSIIDDANPKKNSALGIKSSNSKPPTASTKKLPISKTLTVGGENEFHNARAKQMCVLRISRVELV
jgi:hypothetical protein